MKVFRYAALAGGMAIVVSAESLVVGAAFVYAVASGFGLDSGALSETTD
jgi:hypothetical protein